MMTNIRTFKVKDTVYYSVYNSRGQLALYTSNRTWAVSIARAFIANPAAEAVVVHEAAVGQPKRV